MGFASLQFLGGGLCVDRAVLCCGGHGDGSGEVMIAEYDSDCLVVVW